MAQYWNRYESLLLFDPDLGTETTEELVQRARGFVTNEGGRLIKTDRWGVRATAFELKGRSKAYYLLLEFAGPIQAARELDRRLNLVDTVLKFQTIKLADRIDPEALPEEEDLGLAEPAPEAAPAETEAPAAPEAAEAAPGQDAGQEPPASEEKTDGEGGA